MRILVNASTCVIGGGVQVAASFVNHLSTRPHDSERSWFFALSTQVVRECDETFINSLRGEGRLLTTSVSPGSPIRGYATRKALANACKDFGCDRVFTVFGPSYVNFGVPEYMGFADAFAFNPTAEAYRWHPPLAGAFERFRKKLKIKLAAGAKRYWVESLFAKSALALALNIPESHVLVIPNCVNTRITTSAPPHREPSVPTFFFLAAPYWHKNHMILPEVLRALVEMRQGINLRIITTLPPESPLWLKLSTELKRVGVAKMVINAGPLLLNEVADQLSSSTAVIQISLLETFSSTYLEAMACGVPLLVSDRVYARDICEKNAIYADPLDPIDIARKILELVDNPDLRTKLAIEGKKQLSKFPDANTKNENLIRFCTQ